MNYRENNKLARERESRPIKAVTRRPNLPIYGHAVKKTTGEWLYSKDSTKMAQIRSTGRIIIHLCFSDYLIYYYRFFNSIAISRSLLSKIPMKISELESASSITIWMMTLATLLKKELKTQESHRVSSLRDTKSPRQMEEITCGRTWTWAWISQYTHVYSVSLIATSSPENSTIMSMWAWHQVSDTQTTPSSTLEQWSIWNKTHLIWLRPRNILRLC